ncbi:MAG: radical SAM protein, partial [Candidatus Omnitrophota bacterium]
LDFITSHPKDATIELFEAMRDLDRLSKHLHLPLQSGSNRILKLMNRCYTVEQYQGLIRAFRRIVPGGTVTTDVIVGFPTETAGDFEMTKKVMEDICFDGAYVFKYSPRPPAVSAEMEDDVPVDEKKRRNNVLLKMHAPKIGRDRKRQV